MKYFLDTNICIYFLKGEYPSIQAELEQKKPSDIKIPSVVKAELLYGVEKSQKVAENRQKVAGFLSPFEILPLGDSECEAYARIRVQLERQGTPIGANDLMIASIVVANKGTLVTNNENEFGQVKGLKIQNWVRQESKG